MSFEAPPFPPGYKPDPSAIWIVLGLMAFDFLFMLICIFLVALAEERRRKSIEKNPLELKPGAGKFGVDRGEIWIADDFDAPLILVEDRPERTCRKS
jgi:hypothetical protein